MLGSGVGDCPHRPLLQWDPLSGQVPGARAARGLEPFFILFCWNHLTPAEAAVLSLRRPSQCRWRVATGSGVPPSPREPCALSGAALACRSGTPPAGPSPRASFARGPAPAAASLVLLRLYQPQRACTLVLTRVFIQKWPARVEVATGLSTGLAEPQCLRGGVPCASRSRTARGCSQRRCCLFLSLGPAPRHEVRGQCGTLVSRCRHRTL